MICLSFQFPPLRSCPSVHETLPKGDCDIFFVVCFFTRPPVLNYCVKGCYFFFVPPSRGSPVISITSRFHIQILITTPYTSLLKRRALKRNRKLQLNSVHFTFNNKHSIHSVNIRPYNFNQEICYGLAEPVRLESWNSYEAPHVQYLTESFNIVPLKNYFSIFIKNLHHTQFVIQL